jgi:hypothetical protein
MRNKQYIWFIPLIWALASSCLGTTEIVCEDPGAEIYVNKRYEGQGTAKIQRMGTPRDFEIEARKSGRVVAETNVSREFTWNTFFIGLFTYYTGFYWAWYLPRDIYLPVNPGQGPNKGHHSPWTDPDIKEPSPWDQPPSNW